MKQTALEWLEEQMKTWGDLPRWMRDDIVSKAKDMEKEQLIDFAWSVSIYERKEIAKYYNETYKNGNK